MGVSRVARVIGHVVKKLCDFKRANEDRIKNRIRE